MNKFILLLLLIINIINTIGMQSALSGTNSSSQSNSSPQRANSFNIRNRGAVKHSQTRSYAACPVKSIPEAGN